MKDCSPIIEQKKIYLNNLIKEILLKFLKSWHINAKSIYKIKDNKVSLISNPDNKKSYFGFPSKIDVKEFLKAGKKFF